MYEAAQRREVMTQMKSHQKELEALRAESECIRDNTGTITQCMGNLKGPTARSPCSRDRHNDVEESKPPGPRHATLLILLKDFRKPREMKQTMLHSPSSEESSTKNEYLTSSTHLESNKIPIGVLAELLEKWR
jgi:hypothetical protein